MPLGISSKHGDDDQSSPLDKQMPEVDIASLAAIEDVDCLP